MAKITKVPNGPLIKKKGPFKGSTLKTGGKIKKAQDGKGLTSSTQPVNSAGEVTTGMANPYKTSSGSTMSTSVRNTNSLTSKTQPVDSSGNVTTGMVNPYKTNTSTPKPLSTGFRKGGTIKKAQVGTNVPKTDKPEIKPGGAPIGNSPIINSKTPIKTPIKTPPVNPPAGYTKGSGYKSFGKTGIKIKKAKAGAMIKRADGSMSKRGLWDNIRANKGSGKKPTKQMLVQEKKIKAKSKK